MDKNGEGKIEPASLTKMMTAYLLFEALKSGKLKLTDSFPVSERAWRMQGSKMYVELGNNIKIEDLLRGIVVQSGNDACIVVAEGMAGSEESFAERMNAKAKEFGMTGTHFVNSNGWPDPDHYTTARDLEVLARHLIADYPEYYHYFSELNFTYHGIKQGNRDPLLYKHVGADGIKTGHAEGPGYSLVSSGVQNGRRIIMVVQGLDSKQSRSDEALELYQWAFRNFDNYKLAKAEAPLVAAPVWLGAEETVALGPKTDLVLTLPRGRARPDQGDGGLRRSAGGARSPPGRRWASSISRRRAWRRWMCRWSPPWRSSGWAPSAACWPPPNICFGAETAFWLSAADSSPSKAARGPANRPRPAGSRPPCAPRGSRSSRPASPAAPPARRKFAACSPPARRGAGRPWRRPCCITPPAPTISAARSGRRWPPAAGSCRIASPIPPWPIRAMARVSTAASSRRSAPR